MSEKTKAELLKEKLFLKQPDAYETMSDGEIDDAYSYCEGYKAFLKEI